MKVFEFERGLLSEKTMLCSARCPLQRLNKVLYILLGCSLCCSILFALISYRLESGVSTASVQSKIGRFPKLPLLINSRQQIVDNKRGLVKELEKEINVLKRELSYYQNAMYESGQKRAKKEQSVPCQSGFGIAKCQVLHVAIVCAGFKDSRRVVTLIKSMLFYRRQPLHFHFISDEAAHLVLKTLFETWKLQQVLVSFYDTEKLKSHIEWIPNRHYSGIFGLMKLVLTETLPSSLHQVVVLDTDVFFLADIAELWSLFHKFSKTEAIGLVENQSKWYLGKLFKNLKPWPALGRGFNTGVILMDLQKLRRLKWSHLWRLTAEKELMNLHHTHLADQDVINAALKDNPYLVYRLPCVWNIQLSDNTQSEQCYGDVSSLKLIHWNSPKKSSVEQKHVEYFRNMYLTFLQYDGNLLRRELFYCEIGGEKEDGQLHKSIPDNDPCHEYFAEQQRVRRVHLYFLDFDIEQVDSDVTLVAHSSMDRLQLVEALLKHWEGPVSLSLYLSDTEAQQFLRFSSRSHVFEKRKNVGVHLVYKDGDFYPVNYLRNVALQQAKTKFVFLTDIDFLPLPGLYEKLKRKAVTYNMKQKAIVIPAFETFQYKLDFPNSKSKLLELLDSGIISTFRYSVWPEGHRATNFHRWRSATKDYKIKWEKDFEPYVLLERENMPLYDPRFIGFGWNKVSHIMHLHALKYEFIVAADAFIVHMPHAPSFDLISYRFNKNYRGCLAKLKSDFATELEVKYAVKFS